MLKNSRIIVVVAAALAATIGTANAGFSAMDKIGSTAARFQAAKVVLKLKETPKAEEKPEPHVHIRGRVDSMTDKCIEEQRKFKRMVRDNRKSKRMVRDNRKYKRNIREYRIFRRKVREYRDFMFEHCYAPNDRTTTYYGREHAKSESNKRRDEHRETHDLDP